MKIFITGAAGFIGGSIAEKLVASGNKLTGLTRSEENAVALQDRGIAPIIGSLDDADVLTAAAQAADAVIHAADADHAASIATLVGALEHSGKLLIHTSGSSIVADHADGEYAAETPLSEDSWFEPVPFREARIAMNRLVRQASIDKGIRGIVIAPTMVYGTGRGLHPDSDQLPKLIGLSRKVGAGVYFGKGLNIYSNVHIDDLVDLYELAIEKAPGGSLFFAENGHNSFLEIAAMIARLPGFEDKTTSIPIEQVIAQNGEAARLGVASNSYVSATNARRLGWSPKGRSLEQWMNEMR